MYICYSCRGINVESLSAPGGYEHVLSGMSLRSSWVARPKSCALCELIRSSWYERVRLCNRRAPLRLALTHHLSGSGSMKVYLKLCLGTQMQSTRIFVMADYDM